MAPRNVVGVAGLSLLLTLAAPPAFAAEDSGEGVAPVAIETFTSNDIESSVTTELQSEKSEYLEEMSRQGSLVDESTVNAASLNGETSVLWDDSLQIDSVTLAKDQSSDSGVELAVQSHRNDEQPALDVAPTGLGLISSGLSGGTVIAQSCYTTTVSSNDVTSCYMKVRPKSYTSLADADRYYYERWATAYGASVSGTVAGYKSPQILDIRSRPWSGTTNVTGLADYWPRGGSTGCSGSGDASFGYAGMSVTIPMQNCSTTDPIPNATSRTMGVIYDQGAVVSGRSKTASFGMAVKVKVGTTPRMADYSYARFCNATLCGGAVGNLRKDSGW